MKPATEDTQGLPRDAVDALPWLACTLLALLTLQGNAVLDALVLMTLTCFIPPRWRLMKSVVIVITGTLFALAVVLGFADQALDFFFARPADIQYDILLLPTVWDLAEQSSGFAATLDLFGGGLVLLFGLGWYGAQAVRKSLPLATTASVRLPLLVATAFFIWADVPSKSPATWTIAGLQGAISINNREDPFEQELLKAENETLQLPWDLDQIAGNDVLLFFVESYGRVMWDDPNARAAFIPVAEESVTALEDAGYYIANTFFQSPTFGGRSWLAHMAVLTGVTTNHQSKWARMLSSRILPLAHYFNIEGYETITAAPNINLESWPEGEFFQFQKSYGRLNWPMTALNTVGP